MGLYTIILSQFLLFAEKKMVGQILPLAIVMRSLYRCLQMGHLGLNSFPICQVAG